MESKFRYHDPQQQIPQQFLCPISQKIMTDPVLNKQAISFQRQQIIKWINKNGNDPFSRQPLRVQQLKPNRGLRDAIHTYLKNLPNLKRERLQLVQMRNLKEAIQIRQKQMQKMGYKYQTPMGYKSRQKQQSNDMKNLIFENQKLKKQISILKESSNEAQVFQVMTQQYQKLFQNYKKLEEQNFKLKLKSQVLQTQFEKFKENCKCNGMMIMKQPLGNQKIEKNFKIFKETSINLTPDYKFGSLKYGYCTRLNAKACKVKDQINRALGLFSIQHLPNQGIFTFSFKALEIHENKKLSIGIIQSKYKQKQTWQQRRPHYLQYCLSYQSIIKPVSQHQNKMEQIYIKNADDKLKQVPCLVDVTVSYILNTITWYFNGKKQADCVIPEFMRNKKLCAYANIWCKGDSIQFI